MHDSIIMASEAFRALTDNLCLRLLSFRASRTRSIQLSTSTFSDKTEHYSLFARLSLQRLDVLAGEPHPLAGFIQRAVSVFLSSFSVRDHVPRCANRRVVFDVVIAPNAKEAAFLGIVVALRARAGPPALEEARSRARARRLRRRIAVGGEDALLPGRGVGLTVAAGASCGIVAAIEERHEVQSNRRGTLGYWVLAVLYGGAFASGYL